MLPGNYGTIDVPERRGTNRFRIDRSISLGNILTLIILLWTIFNQSSKIISEFNDSHKKTNIMWEHFIREDKDLTPDDRNLIGR